MLSSKFARTRMTISLPPTFLKDAERLARKERRTKSELVREALRQYILREEKWEAIYAYGTSQAKKLGIRNEKDAVRLVKEYRREQIKKSV